MSEAFSRLLAADVDILLGTDAGAVPDHFFGYTGHRELEIFVRLGMSARQAIVAGTSRPAERLGLSEMGTLAAGKTADFARDRLHDGDKATVTGKLLSRSGSRGPRAVEIQAKVITPPKQSRAKAKSKAEASTEEELPIVTAE
mgnify:CR=1 FL=1